MYSMSYGVVVNWGLSKISELRRSDLLLSTLLFPGWEKAIWALRCQISWMYLWRVRVHQRFFFFLALKVFRVYVQADIRLPHLHVFTTICSIFVNLFESEQIHGCRKIHLCRSVVDVFVFVVAASMCCKSLTVRAKTDKTLLRREREGTFVWLEPHTQTLYWRPSSCDVADTWSAALLPRSRANNRFHRPQSLKDKVNDILYFSCCQQILWNAKTNKCCLCVQSLIHLFPLCLRTPLVSKNY